MAAIRIYYTWRIIINDILHRYPVNTDDCYSNDVIFSLFPTYNFKTAIRAL